MSKLVRIGFCLAVTLLLLPSALWAAATLTGTVTIEGTPVPGAHVAVGGRAAMTDFEGRFTIEDAPSGRQTIVVTAPGFKSHSRQVEVPSQGTLTEDFNLAADLLFSETIVVTGDLNPLTKRESSVAISTLSEEQISQREARSTADLLKAVPGFYVESSGGEVGGNLWARGLPADGSYRYVALMEDGMPVYDSTELSFVNADIFVRVDENIDRLEAVRGGNPALFGGNAPGGAINLLSKTGGSVPETLVRLTAGTDGLGRVGFNTNGPVGQDWTFNLGGFYRFDRGVRDPGFPASQGGQIKFNATRNFDHGFARFYVKYLNDLNIFYLPLPFKAGGAFVDGFGFEGTLTTPEGNQVRVPRPNQEGMLTLPLDDGQRQEGVTLMGEFVSEMPNGWSVHNTLRYVDMDHTWNAVVPFDLRSPADIAADSTANPQCGGAIVTSCYSYSFTNSSDTFATSNNLLLEAGLWHIRKPLMSIANQLQLSRTYDAGSIEHKVSVGTYLAHYEADNVWFFNNILTDVRDNPRFVDLTLIDGAGNPTGVTQNGFRRYGDLFVNATGNVDVAALFAGDQIQFSDRFRLDLGARIESDKYRQTSENTTNFDLGDPTTLADDSVGGGTGTFARGGQSFSEWAFSVGANYILNDSVALYGRASRGYKMPILDNFLFGPQPDPPLEAEQILQFEVGAKIGTPVVGVNVSGFYLTVEDFPSQDVRVDPITGATSFVTDFVGEAETFGVEVELVTQPVEGLRIDLSLTGQLPEYTDFFRDEAPTGPGPEDDLSGNRIRRLPEFFSNLTVAYHWKKINISGNYVFFGNRYSNDANTVPLPNYDVSNFRASFDLSPNSRVNLAVVNAFNSKGLTEGNPRLDESAIAAGAVFLARPVLPRRGMVTYEYRF